MVVGGGEFCLTHSYLFFFFSVERFTHLNIKKLQSPGNLNILPGKTKTRLKIYPKLK